MITTLYWGPNSSRNRLSNELKYILAKRIWSQDGFIPSSTRRVLNRKDLPYLRGLADSDIKGVEELANAIDRQGSVVVWIEKGGE